MTDQRCDYREDCKCHRGGAVCLHRTLGPLHGTPSTGVNGLRQIINIYLVDDATCARCGGPEPKGKP